MPSHYDAKRDKPKSSGSYEQSESAYQRWHDAGLNCYHSNADCANCPQFQSGMFHKRTGMARWKCSQPESNSKLIAQGILPKEERDAG